MILSIYLHISVFCLLIYMMYFTMVRCHIGNETDVWKEIKDLQESMEQLDEKTQNFINNLFNSFINNPNNVLIFMFIMSFIPLIHLFTIYGIVKAIAEKLK